jgi:hypothetical protein
MNRFRTTVSLLLFVVFPPMICYAQDLMVIPGDTVISGNPGSEMVAYIYVVNISSFFQTIFIARTENDLPEGWTSSLCFNGSCFASYIDSVFSSESCHPQDTLEASVYFSPDKINTGIAHVQIQIGTLHNLHIRTTINLTASTMPTAVVEPVNASEKIILMQNYPNPFNPITKIKYTIPQNPLSERGETGGFVTLKVYDVLGKEISTLVNEEKPGGSYEVEFDGSDLTSGNIFYRIQTRKFVETKKMVLVK